MDQQRTRPAPVLGLIWMIVGLGMIGVALWVTGTRFRVLLAGHPITAGTAFGLVVAGLLAVLLGGVAVVERLRPPAEPGSMEPGSLEPGSTGRSRREVKRPARNSVLRRRVARVISVPALLVCVLATALLGYSRPMGADDTALAALRPSATIAVQERLTSYELVPTRENSRGVAIPVTTGLVFYPGAKVDARAYAALLRPLAAAGYLVVVLKEPFGLALLEPGQARGIPALHPEITHWAVGGHSLGGVAAAGLADQDETFTGLLLYASEPASALARSDLSVLSVSGTEDGLETPAKIADSRSELPASTRFVAVQGAVHAYFGDYGDQPGDGTPNVDRGVAQATIATATKAFLAGLAAGRSGAGTAGTSASASSTASASASASASPSASPS